MKARAIKISRGRRRGVIFITVMAVMVILSALLLVFAANMRIESLASANRMSAAQADAVEQGAEQWIMANIEQYGNNTNGVDVLALPAQAIQVGQGYFWIIRPNMLSNQDYDFGIQDESAKVNINTALPQQLALLPGMNPEIAQAIFDWRSPNGGSGGEGSYYESLPEPYESKNAPYESVEELMLVEGVNSQLMYGYDTNRNGVIDPGEQSNGASSFQLDVGEDTSRGMSNYLTIYSARKNTTGQGPTIYGRINVYTASEAVLMTVTAPNGQPVFSQSQADQIIANRTTGQAESTSVGTLLATISPRIGLTAAQQNTLLAGRAAQYSADIVAVSGDGRAFKRVKVVVTVPPYGQDPVPTATAKIVYRKDLTGLGWPLPQDLRDSMRKGLGIPPQYQASATTSTMGSSQIGVP